MQRITRKILISLPAVATTLTFLFLPVLTHAQGIEPTPFAPFGMLGLARAQTARLNLVNLLPPDASGISPCVRVLSFWNSVGIPFVTPAGTPGQEVSLLPGESAFLDLTSREAFPRDSRESRMPFRGQVNEVGGTPPDDGLPDPCAGLVATLEIFDNFTGRTVVLYALPPPVGSNPPDDSLPPGE